MTEEERSRVYEMCRVLGMVFEVWKDGVLVGVFKYVDDKIVKLNLPNL